jgi:hypothetical protein
MSEKKEYYHCAACGYELDTGWECSHCGADWEAEATGLNPSEAVYGFAAWLTTRDAVTTLSARHDSGVIADLVKEFCAIQGLPPSDDGYDSLRAVLAQAVEQASGGKGKERHSTGQPFDQQPICQGGRRFGINGLVYQCWKKSHEVPVLMAMDDGNARAVRELLGVINYAAAAILVLQEGMRDE